MKSEKNKPVYAEGSKNFSQELRSQVKAHFDAFDIPKEGNRQLKILSGLLLLLYIFVSASLSRSDVPAPLYFLLCALLGLLTLPLVLNIGHDSVHNVFFKLRKHNEFAGNIFMILGTSPYFWKLRHIHSHHTYANVQGWDKDIEQEKVIRLSAKSPFLNHHKYQHLYMPFVFMFYTLNWFFYRDFKDLFTKSFGTKTADKHPFAELIKLFVAKFIMLGYLIVLPVYLGHQSISTALIGFVLFHIAASVVTTFALVSTHVGTQQEVLHVANGKLPYSYDEHQLRTTSDFATGNKFLTWYYGGFNHHVAHHLFPNYSHVHYPVVTLIIKRCCTMYNMPYLCTPTLKDSIAEHLKLLRELGKRPGNQTGAQRLSHS